jgi:hypothetical protein
MGAILAFTRWHLSKLSKPPGADAVRGNGRYPGLVQRRLWAETLRRTGNSHVCPNLSRYRPFRDSTSSIETNDAGTSFAKYRAVVEFGNTIFQDGDAPTMPWWSLSKTVIAAAALALVKRGRLTLDDPVVGESYTLRQLLQHTSGLPD